MANVFISYRRAETASEARALFTFANLSRPLDCAVCIV